MANELILTTWPLSVDNFPVPHDLTMHGTIQGAFTRTMGLAEVKISDRLAIGLSLANQI